MKFLIVRLSSLGDIVHSLPLVNQLKRYDNNSQIDWLVGYSGYEFLSHIKELNKIYLPNDISTIQKQKYDYVIDVQGLFKSALLSRLSCGKETIGFKRAREFAYVFYDTKIETGDLFKTKRHVVDLNLELISKFKNEANSKVKFLIPKIDFLSNEEFLRAINLKSNKVKSMVVFPGTTWESKLWIVEYWLDLLSEISHDFKIYLCASNKDGEYIKKLTEKLNSHSVSYCNLAGKTSFSDLIYLIQRSDLVIGMDSFGLHLASAIKNDYGYPEIIGIFGPTSPHRNGPYNLAKSYLYLSELKCIACRKKTCPLGHHKCMNNIVPRHVYEMIYSIMNERVKV